MLRSKKDVDRHVQDIFRKLEDENEKTLRCFKIAELYYNVNDYESARRYLSRYIEIRKEPKAHKLMGQILEALGQKEAALTQYKYSFELNAKQEDLIFKTAPDVGIDVNQAKYWVERADSLFPREKIVFQLKEKVLSIEKPTNNEEDLENLILAELAARPTDVLLRVKLLKHYIEKGKIKDAYKHASDIEGISLHRDSLPWYQTLCDLFLRLKSTKQTSWNFWILYISSLERYAALALKEQGCFVKKTSEVVQAVYNFDQHLFESKAQSFTSYPSLTEKIFEHMWGQLHFHIACLLLLNTKYDQGSWNEAGRLCAPLLLTALHVKPLDLTSSWAAHVDNPIKNLLQFYYREGSYRCSQAGHILQDYSKGNLKKLMSDIEKFCTGSWRERVYQRIFVGRIYQKIRTSYFTNSNVLAFPLRLVSQNELRKFDEVAEEVWPYSLHHQVWPAVKSRNSSTHTIKHEGPQPNLSSHLFSDLQFSVYNITNASPSTICQLDIDAFLNAAALCAGAVDEEQQRNTLLHPDRLPTLPADLTNPLCSEEQEKWWSSAMKVHRKDTVNNVGEIRQTLQRGLEVVRCIGNHGMHPNILVHLARVFHYRAKQLKEKSSENSEIAALESRSELYWSAVVPLLERLQNNQTIWMSNVKLFDYTGKSMNNMELTHAIEEGKLLLAQKLIKDELYEQAIEALQVLKCPEASFEQGKIYKIMADRSLDSMSKESITSEMRSQHIIMLTKARNCFYLTLDRLRSPKADPKHPLNAELYIHINSIENELKAIDPDKLYSDEESYSSAHSEERQIVNNSIQTLNNNNTNNTLLHTPTKHHHRTPKQSSTPRCHQIQDYSDTSRNCVEARPSPERLDAQIRQLVHSVESLKEQNRDQHRAMISKLDELIKISARNCTKEAPKTRPPPKNVTSTIEDELYGYGEDDYNFNTTPVPSASTLGNRVLATPRHFYSPMVYPPVNHTGLQNFFQSPLPFADPAASMYAANAAALAAAAASATGYPMSPMYRTGHEQLPIASMQQMTENLQQGLFSHRPNEYAQSQQLQQLQQPFGLHLNEPAKSEPRMGYTAMNEPSLPEISTLNLKDTSVSAPALTTSSAIPASGPRGGLPVNVVITTSDTLPTTTPSSQPPMSVTIPAHHRLGVTPSQDVPHSYQISMPPQPTILTTVNLPPLSTTLTMTSPMTKTNVTDNQNTSIVSTGSRHSTSDVTEVEHDPIPDFAPIIPLPDEVPVTTGEENETTLFCARAKLFRFVDKEWKERGIGDVKLLKSEDGRVRLLMRREQVHKICANHMLHKDMELTQMPKNEKAYVWVANDFADEEVRLEKLCIKFKTAEEAASFKETFDKVIVNLPDATAEEIKVKTTTEETKTEKPKATAATKTDATVEKFGGFTFTSSPVVQKPVEEVKQAPAKPSPFASFSFGKTSEVAKTSNFTFGSSTTTASSASSSNLPSQGSAKSTFEPTKLAETSKVNDKEAGEIVVLEQHAELMYFPSNTKIWNVKGKGVVKVFLESSSRRVRLIFNTDDNSKTVLNEVIPETIIFSVKADQVIWSMETKAISNSYLLKFKNHEQASSFRATMQDQKGQSKVKPANEQKPLSAAPAQAKTAQSVSKNLFEQFKPPVDSWECKDCYTRNNAGATSCVACQAAAPGQAKTPQPTSKNLFEQFKPPVGSWECKDCYTRNNAGATSCVACQATAPGVTPSQPAAVAPSISAWNCKKCKIVNAMSAQYCVTCDEPRDPSMPPKPKTIGGFSINALKSDTKSTFTFGIPPANQQPATAATTVTNKDTPSSFNFSFTKSQSEKAASSPIPIFGANKTATSNAGFSHDSQPPTTPPASAGHVDNTMKFGSPGKSFDFQFQAKSPQSPDRHETSEDEQVVESEDIYFAPVIPLPDKIEVKTGEEDEDVLYSHRAKLFKFDTNTKEWKERGLGEIKVLRHVQTKKLRLIMRRDQVLKLCLNHALSSAIEITSKDNKTWIWSAGDYSEGAVEYIQFACRFKTPEIARQFKKAVDDACKAVSISPPKTTVAIAQKADLTKKESSQDVEIVYETTVTAEEKAAALKLRLPENFYAYKYKDDCRGCLGCREPEEPLLKPVESKPTPGAPVFGAETPASGSPFAFNANAFSQSPATNAQTAAKPIFGAPITNIFGGVKNDDGNAAKQTSLVFGQTPSKPDSSQDTGLENLKICSPTTKQQTSTTSTAATTSASSIFGGFVTQPAATATSGSTNIFGNFSSPSINMFGGTPTKTTSATPAFTFSAPNATAASNTTTNNIFSTNKSSPFSAGTNTFGTTNMFGGSPASTTNSVSLFGGSPASTTSSSSLFGGSVTTTTTSKPMFGTIGPMFGSTAPAITTATSSVFGTSSGIASTAPTFGASAGNSIFGGITASTTSATPVFGTATSTTSLTSVFGVATTTTSATPVFGATAITKSATPVFGATSTTTSSSSFGTNTATTTGTLFSGSSPLFGGQTSIKPLFTAPQADAKPATGISGTSMSLSSMPIFGAQKGSVEGSFTNASNAPADDKSKTKDAGGVSFLPTENSLTFSALAAQTTPDQKPAFQTDPSFQFAGAGASVFGAKSKQTDAKKSAAKSKKDKDKKNDDDEDDEDDGDENGDEHDPYFEPIVPLPDAIEVRTGEEDEEKLFCQRAKLYRYDQNTKEWKERGTGEMKLLHNVQHGTYRLLLRREQVFKVVCNVRLTADLEFHKMSTSNSAWVWAAMNYAEPDNAEVEKLAVRFKSTELAEEFYEAVSTAQRSLTELQNEATANASAVSQEYEDEVYDEDEYYGRGDYDEDEEGGEDEDDEDAHVEMFEKRATIYVKNEGENDWDERVMGNLRVIYDSDLFGVRILFMDDNTELRSDTVICMNTQMECADKECLWSATDYATSPPVRRTLKAVFSSTQTSHEMYKTYLEGKDCATKADIRE
ncbi:E3 SUMO-protein ligase RanBP2 isoform X2 [Copidosoma floridanum]|uniref:E3 SUMO-protein ligase RanBP2 isoform X2 n=1 Tax=Copidosoma floridanum TaxID=29053 RepID=UPI0006C9B2F9|nr:E3 SUMO-protein ligase RanBP2 isoform X2 [Copidosoma floridanum]